MRASNASCFSPSLPARPSGIDSCGPTRRITWRDCASSRSVEAGKPQRCAIALDDEPPKIVALPVSTGETDRPWQQDVLRNAALASSVLTVADAGLHTLKIWMVDSGIVLDAITADTDNALQSSYLCPPEIRLVKK
jgi:hypothetical protein